MLHATLRRHSLLVLCHNSRSTKTTGMDCAMLSMCSGVQMNYLPAPCWLASRPMKTLVACRGNLFSCNAELMVLGMPEEARYCLVSARISRTGCTWQPVQTGLAH